MNFEDLIPTLDDTVDAMFAVPVVLQPWKQGTYAAGAADPDRDPLECYGVYETGTAAPGSLGGSSGGGFLTRVEGAELMLSIQKKFVDMVNLQKGDLVVFTDPANNFVAEVLSVPPEATERPDIPLIRSQMGVIPAMARKPSKSFKLRRMKVPMVRLP